MWCEEEGLVPRRLSVRACAAALLLLLVWSLILSSFHTAFPFFSPLSSTTAVQDEKGGARCVCVDPTEAGAHDAGKLAVYPGCDAHADRCTFQ